MREMWLENPRRKRARKKSKKRTYKKRGTSNMAKKRRYVAKRRNPKTKVIFSNRRRRRRNQPPLKSSFVDAAYATTGFFATKFAVPRVTGLLNLSGGQLVNTVVEVGTSVLIGTIGERFINKNAGRMMLVGGVLGMLANLVEQQGLLSNIGLGSYTLDRGALCPSEGFTMGQLPPGNGLTQDEISELTPANQLIPSDTQMPERLQPYRVQ